MQMFPKELGLANLKGELSPDERGFMPVEAAYQFLKKLSGLDFGYDVERWTKWVDDTGPYLVDHKSHES